MSMSITKVQYNDMKEYWDYQRKVQYNKETIYRMAEQFENRVISDFGMVDLETIKDHLWTRVKSEDYEEPHKGWVPQDPNYRFDWEPDPNDKRLPPPKGKKVIVASKDKWQDIFEELDNNIDKKSKI